MFKEKLFSHKGTARFSRGPLIVRECCYAVYCICKVARRGPIVRIVQIKNRPSETRKRRFSVFQHEQCMQDVHKRNELLTPHSIHWFRYFCRRSGGTLFCPPGHYMNWADWKNLVKGCRETLNCHCLSCELLSACIADALWFVNMVCLPLIAEQNAHEIHLTQECLQIVRRLLWKQTTIHSLRNNNPMFHGNLWPSSFDQLSIAYWWW